MSWCLFESPGPDNHRVLVIKGPDKRLASSSSGSFSPIDIFKWADSLTAVGWSLDLWTAMCGLTYDYRAITNIYCISLWLYLSDLARLWRVSQPPLCCRGSKYCTIDVFQFDSFAPVWLFFPCSVSVTFTISSILNPICHKDLKSFVHNSLIYLLK